MSRMLHVLQVEDSEGDAALIIRFLQKANYDVRWERVETAGDMQQALDRQAWDLVIADYSMPQFNAAAALKLLQKTGLDIPFIVVSGTIGEDTAVAMMRAGAHDYLMKDKLTRLAPAVERELREVGIRRENRRAAVERESMVEFLRLINQSTGTRDLIEGVTGFFQRHFGCEAVGVRLQEGEDYPYYETRGFPPAFVLAEKHLCRRDAAGHTVHDSAGAPVLECMCGNVICGRFNPEKPFFTRMGSFWTNSTTQFLATTTEADRQARTRNCCNGEGYESVALIPLAVGAARLGLLQLNDRRPGRFTPELIALWERMAGYLSVTLQKCRAEEALHESEERYKAIFNRSLECIYIHDFQGQFLDANDAALNLMGYQRADITAINIATLVNPDQLLLIGKLLEEMKATGVQKELAEFRLRCKNGNYVDVETKAAVIYRAGKPFAIQGIARNITERKQAEQALRDSEQRLQMAKTAARMGIYDHDLVMGTITWDQCIRELWGVSPDLPITFEVIKSTVHPEDHAAIKTALDRAYDPAGDGQFKIEYRITNRVDGIERWLASTGQVLFEQGRAVRIVGTVHDITERKRAEQQVADALAFNQTLIQVSPVGIQVFKADGQCVLANEAVAQIIGGSVTEILTHNFCKLDSWKQSGLLEAAQTALAEQSEQKRETRVVSVFGKEFWLSYRLVPFFYGGELHLLGLFSDITERKRNEEYLRQALEQAQAASRTKSSFLANMSHELRTPLNGVMGMTELLLGSDLDAEQKEYAETVYRSAESLLTILNDVLDLARVEAGQVKLEPAPFELAQVVSDVVELFRPQLIGGRVEIVGWTDPNLIGFMLGDAARLRQILVNLVSNAVKFTTAGSIMVSAIAEETADQQARFILSVQDSGPGIPPDYLPHLYQPFMQAESTYKRSHGGLGLGLANIKRLVDLMGGSIEVVTTAGCGTTFAVELTLPMALEESITESALLSSSAELATAGSIGRVLLVEDNPLGQKIAAKMLVKLDMLVTVAGNGREALDLLEKERFDLVLMDCQMPEMDGFEATRVIRSGETHTGQHVPIIALTAHVMKGDRERCLMAGMDDYLAKPVKLDALRATLNKWGRSHFHRSVEADSDQRAVLPDEVAPESISPFSEERLRQLRLIFSAADDELLATVLRPFASDLAVQTATLTQSVLKRDWKRVEEAAHRLKGSASNVGALKLAHLAQQLIAQALLSNEWELDGVMDQFLIEFENVKTAIVQMEARST